MFTNVNHVVLNLHVPNKLHYTYAGPAPGGVSNPTTENVCQQI